MHGARHWSLETPSSPPIAVIPPTCSETHTAPTPPVDKIGKEFRPYFDAFVEEMNARAPDSTIDFSRFLIRFAEPGELDSTLYGTCSRRGGDTILISRKDWEDADSVTGWPTFFMNWVIVRFLGFIRTKC